MKKLFAGITIGVALIFTSSAAFAVVLYDEGVGGDLDSIGSTSLNLVAGTNEIKGVIPQTPPQDTDRIKFVQTAGLVVDSITLSFQGPWDTANIGQSLNTALYNSVANLFDDSFNTVISPATINASFYDSAGPEIGALSTTTDGAIWDFQLSADTVYPDISWTLTINTTAVSAPPPPRNDVPEPGVLWLLGGGLLGFAAIRRRKRS